MGETTDTTPMGSPETVMATGVLKPPEGVIVTPTVTVEGAQAVINGSDNEMEKSCDFNELKTRKNAIRVSKFFIY